MHMAANKTILVLISSKYPIIGKGIVMLGSKAPVLSRYKQNLIANTQSKGRGTWMILKIHYCKAVEVFLL